MRMLPGGSVTIYKALFVKVAAQILLMLLKVFPKSVAIAQLLKIEPLSSYNQCDILQMRKSQETQDSENLPWTNILNFCKALKKKSHITGKILEVSA